MKAARLRREASVWRDTRAISASTPPSPPLSARITKTRYLIEMTRISDQTISDSTPNTLSGVGAMPWGPWKHSRRAYSGLVPMSP